jgi:hypothetical protein
MTVHVCLPLFGEPGRELEGEKTVSGRQLRELGEQLRERLQKAADSLDKLKAGGWTAQVALYEAILTRDGVETREQAEAQLRAAGVDPNELMIVEEVEDEEE